MATDARRERANLARTSGILMCHLHLKSTRKVAPKMLLNFKTLVRCRNAYAMSAGEKFRPLTNNMEKSVRTLRRDRETYPRFHRRMS